MEERLRRVVAEVLDVSPESVTDETSPETVETWDSLTHLRLITAVEAEFEIQLSMQTIQSIQSVADLRAELQKPTEA